MVVEVVNIMMLLTLKTKKELLLAVKKVILLIR